MASFVLTDAEVLINGVDLSDHFKSVKVNYSADLLDATAMAMGGKARRGGLKDWSIEFETYQDYAAGKVDATIWPLVGVQTTVAVKAVKSQAISATNPQYQGNGIIGSYPPVSGGVGEMAMASFTMEGADGVPLIRDTVP